MLKSSNVDNNKATELLRKVVADLENTSNRDVQNRIYSNLLSYSSRESMSLARALSLPGQAETIDRLRCLRADYVFRLESEWARKIIRNKSEISKLNKVQYFKNYRRMIRSEFGFIEQFATKPVRNIAFVGSGPFPFTSFSLAREFGVRVINVDIDQEALATSMELATSYGVHKKMEYVCSDARYLELDSSIDVVMVAALVGHHADDKNEIINGFEQKLDKHQMLAARTAVGLKQLFYVGVDSSGIDMRCLGLSTPPKGVINSLMVFRKK